MEIGSAMAAQIYMHLTHVMPIENYLEKGNMKEIKDYLSKTYDIDAKNIEIS